MFENRSADCQQDSEKTGSCNTDYVILQILIQINIQPQTLSCIEDPVNTKQSPLGYFNQRNGSLQEQICHLLISSAMCDSTWELPLSFSSNLMNFCIQKAKGN